MASRNFSALCEFNDACVQLEITESFLKEFEDLHDETKVKKFHKFRERAIERLHTATKAVVSACLQEQI